MSIEIRVTAAARKALADLGLCRGGLVAQPGLLDRVLGLAHAAEDPVGDREQQRPQLLELLGPGHAASSLKPSRHVGYRSSQPSSRLALALENGRPSVMIATPISPASGRTSHLGIRSGRFAPTHAARYGSHSLTGAGSSSPMLNTPFARCSPAT